MKIFNRIRHWFRSLPNRKAHLDFFIALLSVPVLLTVVFTNVLNLQNKSKPGDQQSAKNSEKIIIQNVPDKTTSPSQTTKNNETPSACKKQVGPISISYPTEGQVVSDNPVCIIIKYEDSSYCSVVWSYKINNGSWSGYSSNSVCLYNIPKGDVKFELRSQSTASQDQTNLTRNFSYQEENLQITPSLSATQSSILK